MKPFFSIIIPTLNEQDYIPHILSDLNKQKEKDFEILIVDGTSQDKTKQYVEKFKQTLPIRFFEVKKQNVSFQRNFGAQKAKGNYLFFIDADSGINTSFTKQLKKTILKRKGLVFIPWILPDEKTAQAMLVFNLINFFVELSQNFNKPFSTGGTMIIEINTFHTLGGFDEKLFLAEDHNVIQRAYQWGIRAKFLRNAKVEFCLRRMKREGELTLLYKSLVATFHVLLRGDIKTKIFDYSMGGEPYKSIKKDLSSNKLQFYIDQIKDFLFKPQK